LAKKRVKIATEFKAFVLRGNVIDLAVGVIIGGAFNKIVTSLVNDVIMPVISIIIGTAQFNNLFIALDGGDYATLEAAGSAPLLKYGSFIAAVFDFLLMALVIFLLVKIIAFVRSKLERDKPAEAPAPATKVCPFCMSEIHIDATVCPMCTRTLTGMVPLDEDKTMLFREV
jgi:large conductance mechanosensitive channel